MSYLNQEETGRSISKNNEDFGCVIVNVKDRNLYSAWDRAWRTSIPDYKISEETGERCAVSKREFISRSPEMLIFQINRVEYTEKFEMIKVNDRFDFEKELFVDQFLEKNSQQIIQNERKNQEIEEQLELLQLSLDKLDNFYGEKRSLLGSRNVRQLPQRDRLLREPEPATGPGVPDPGRPQSGAPGAQRRAGYPRPATA